MKFQSRPISPEDYELLLDLNESCVPHVNSIGLSDMLQFSEQSSVFLKWVWQDRLASFVIALKAGETYQSPNYQWFNNSLADFLYIDRIMVHPEFRRCGLASDMYAELTQIAKAQGLKRLCCEVNIEPANPDSMALHLGLGFVQAATQKTEAGKKEVALLIREFNQ